MIPIGEVLSRIRNQVKGVKQDAFLTDRFLYSMVMKHAKMLIRRQDVQNKIMKFNAVFQVLNFVELIEVDRAESQCHCITSGCTFKRTKEKVPRAFEGVFGPLFRSVMSIDLSEELVPTFPSVFQKMVNQKTFKYNNKKYYWYLDGYVYFPNLEWDAVRIEGLFEGDISSYNCDITDDCAYIQDTMFTIPEYLYAEIEQFVIRDLSGMLNIPQDTQQDNKNILK
jgi:hypothetical protein